MQSNTRGSRSVLLSLQCSPDNSTLRTIVCFPIDFDVWIIHTFCLIRTKFSPIFCANYAGSTLLLWIYFTEILCKIPSLCNSTVTPKSKNKRYNLNKIFRYYGFDFVLIWRRWFISWGPKRRIIKFNPIISEGNRLHICWM